MAGVDELIEVDQGGDDVAGMRTGREEDQRIFWKMKCLSESFRNFWKTLDCRRTSVRTASPLLNGSERGARRWNRLDESFPMRPRTGRADAGVCFRPGELVPKLEFGIERSSFSPPSQNKHPKASRCEMRDARGGLRERRGGRESASDRSRCSTSLRVLPWGRTFFSKTLGRRGGNSFNSLCAIKTD